MLLAVIFFMGGVLYGISSHITYETVADTVLQLGECRLSGTVMAKEIRKEAIYYELKRCHVTSNGQVISCPNVRVGNIQNQIKIGEKVCLFGRFQPFQTPTNQGSFHQKEYYKSKNISGQFVCQTVLAHQQHGWMFGERAAELKKRWKEFYLSNLSLEDAGVMIAMTIADTTELEESTKNLFVHAGVSHFYCVSGLHISMLGMTLFGLLRKKCTYLTSFFAASVIMIGYGYLTGFGTSQVRAIGMFIVLLYAKVRGQTYDRITALSLFAVVLILRNPFVTMQAGFFLSFGAVVGVILCEEKKRQKKKQAEKQTEKQTECRTKENHLFRYAFDKGRDVLSVSVSVALVTMPVLMTFYYEIPLYAVGINLIILPLLGILLADSLVTGVLGLFWIEGAKATASVAKVILFVYRWVCQTVAEFPCAQWVTGKPSTWVYLFFILWLFFWQSDGRKREHGTVTDDVRNDERKARKRRRIQKAVICFLLFGVIGIPKRYQPEISMLDVGQGDAICLFGRSQVVMIDGGSSSEYHVGKYTILPFLKYRGVRRVDYWFVSHLDEDHVNGLEEVLEIGYPVRYLIFAEGIPKNAKEFQKLKKLAAKNHTKLAFMKQGDCLTSKDKDFKISCLFPERDVWKEEEGNEHSLVLLYETVGMRQKETYRAVFGGDITSAEEEIICQEQNMKKVDLVKANHHGSKYSNSELWFDTLKPELVLISAGKQNRYGHPHPETIERIRTIHCKWKETAKVGQIRVLWE